MAMEELNNNKLQNLIERAWSLHVKLNDEIENNISFCRFCSDLGRFCDFGQTPDFMERGRLIAIRDSLQEVGSSLLHLQNLQSWQPTDWHSGLSRLEQSRLFLVKQVTQYEGRSLDVVKELSTCFERNVGEITVNKNWVQTSWSCRRRRLSSFLICCIRILFNPWKWENAVGIAVKLVLISASLSSTIRFYQANQKSYSNSPRNFFGSVMVMDSIEAAEKLDSLLTISKNPLDVFCGRG